MEVGIVVPVGLEVRDAGGKSDVSASGGLMSLVLAQRRGSVGNMSKSGNPVSGKRPVVPG